MCFPLAIPLIVAGVMALTAAGTTYMQIQNTNKVAAAEGEAAYNAAISDYNMLNQKQQQINEKTALEESERLRQGRVERAKMMTNMGESGLTGSSFIRQQAASYFDQTWDVGIMEANERSQLLGVRAEQEKVYADASSRINMARSKVPSKGAAALQIAMAGISTGISTFGSMYGMGGKSPTGGAGAGAPSSTPTADPGKMHSTEYSMGITERYA